MNPSAPDPSSPLIPPRWAWHYQRLESLRDRLLEDQDVQLEEARESLESPGIGLADGGTDEFDHALALGLLTHEQEVLAEVEAALRRIREGRYGICEETGQPIQEERLRAVPWTRYTRAVEEIMEREGLIRRPHLGMVSSLQGPGPGGLSQVEDPEEDLPAPETLRQRREADLEAIQSGANPGAAATPPDQP